jgi:hypothetical protein
MVLLPDAGWSPPRIAERPACYPRTARAATRGFDARGIPALSPGKPGPAPDHARRDRVTDRLRGPLGEDRTWTSARLADALRPAGIDLGGRQVRRYLALPNAGLPADRLDPGPRAGPEEGRAGRHRPGRLGKKAAAGRPGLYYPDGCGFSPSRPTGYGWCPPGQRERVRYEYPQGRRVNALAAYEPPGPAPWPGTAAFERALTSDDLPAYLRPLPPAGVPRWWSRTTPACAPAR